MSKTISQNVNAFKRGQYAEKVLTILQVYFENQKMCDVLLIAASDGTRVSAHRVILSACSLYFLDLFSNNGEGNEVQLEDVSGHVLQILIHFCYSGHIEFRKDNVEIYLAAATQLQLTDVVKAGWDYLAKELHPSYCLKVAQIAEKYNCNDALSQAEAFTNQHYMEIVGTDDFFQLSIGQLCRIIVSDDLVVDSEEDAFNSCISWIDHDRNDREGFFPQLLASVRLQLLPLHFIKDKVNPLCKTIESKELIIEAITQTHKLIQKRTISSSPLTQANKSTDETLIVTQNRPNSNFKLLQIYNNSEDKWNKWNANLRSANSYFVLDGMLLAVEANNVTSYDFKSPPVTATCTWRSTSAGRVVLGGYLYWLGGEGSGDTFNRVERWNPKDRLWKNVAPMNEKRSDFGVAALGEHLYAVGGYFQLAYYNCRKSSVERYDPNTNEWTLRTPMNKARSDFQVAAGNGYLYAVGGISIDKTPTDTVERYDPIADKWTMICSISSARYSVACAFFGDRLMAAGGYNGKNNEPTVEEYDIETNQWTLKKPLETNECVYSMVIIPSKTFPTLNYQ